MAKPYVIENEIGDELAAQFVHGTDTEMTLDSVAEFDVGGGYVRVYVDAIGGAWALYEYTAIAGAVLTVTPCTLGDVESDAAYTFPIGSLVERVWMAEDVADLRADHVAKTLFDAQSIVAAVTNNTPVNVTVAEQTLVGRITGGNIDDLSVAQLQTLILSANLPENVSIRLDPVLSADTKWTGITEDGTAGTTALVYGYCYYLASSGKWELAKADAATTSINKLGMCVIAADTDATGTLLLYGQIRADDEFDTFTVGAPVHVSAATAGKLATAAPSGTEDFVVRIAGHAPTGDSLFFCPDNAYVELSQ